MIGTTRPFLNLRQTNDGHVPFSRADVCWCQPFDGPVHPHCPMHGESEQPEEDRAR